MLWCSKLCSREDSDIAAEVFSCFKRKYGWCFHKLNGSKKGTPDSFRGLQTKKPAMNDMFGEYTAARLGAADAVKSWNATKKYKYSI